MTTTSDSTARAMDFRDGEKPSGFHLYSHLKMYLLYFTCSATSPPHRVYINMLVNMLNYPAVSDPTT